MAGRAVISYMGLGLRVTLGQTTGWCAVGDGDSRLKSLCVDVVYRAA
jgi:hypothetical protein